MYAMTKLYMVSCSPNARLHALCSQPAASDHDAAVTQGMNTGIQCTLHPADGLRPACVSSPPVGGAVTLQVHETRGKASAMIMCNSASGRWWSRHPAAADLHPKLHSNIYPLPEKGCLRLKRSTHPPSRLPPS